MGVWLDGKGLAGWITGEEPTERRSLFAAWLQSAGTRNAFLPLVLAGGDFLTHLALLNPSTLQAALLLEFLDVTGHTVVTASLTLPPRTSLRRVLSDLLPGLPASAVGSLRIRSTGADAAPIYALGLLKPTSGSFLVPFLP